MAQFDNKLQPIIVNGKAKISTPDRYVPAYFVMIWAQGRCGDRLYHLINGERHLMGDFDKADMEVSNEFFIERMR